MKAPNKIYLPILPRIENSIISEHCVGTAWDNKEHITIPNIEEYIRKDALLEWAKDWQNELDDSLGASMVHHVLNEVIKKIESL